MQLLDKLPKDKFNQEELFWLKDSYMDRPVHDKNKRLVALSIYVNQTLPRDLYKKILDYFIEKIKCSIELRIIANECHIDLNEVQNYINYLSGLLKVDEFLILLYQHFLIKS